MNKFLMALLVFGGAGIAYYLMGGSSQPGVGEVEDFSAEEVEQAIQDTGKRTVHGSCNAIARASTCIDYVGSMWGDNNMAELNCEGAGTFSKNTCSYSEYGGCQMSGGTVMEIVTWHYREGPGGYDDEARPYAQGACNALPTGTWVTADVLM